MISQSAEYSLRAALCLAAERATATATASAAAAAAPPPALTTQQIAERTRIPVGYLAKVLQVLGRAGLVTSQRGLNGGFVLNGDAAQITLLDLVSAVEPSRRIRACPLGLPGHRDQLCPLHRRLDDAAARVEEMLRGTTLADVLAESAAPAAPDASDSSDAGAHVSVAGLCPQPKGPCACKT